MEPGICYIKEEYLLPEVRSESHAAANTESNNKRKHAEDDNNADAGASAAEAAAVTGDTAANTTAENGATAEKYQKSGKKNRKRGQNKHRPVYKEDRTLHLCHSLVNGPSVVPCTYTNCRYVHDLPAYLAAKGADLGAECPVYNVKGYCPRGVTCRYANTHLDEAGRNTKAETYNENQVATTCNGITTDLQVRLRRHQYDFTRSKSLLTQFEKQRDERKRQAELAQQNEASTTYADKPIGAAVDDADTSGRDVLRKPPVDFAEKLLLSPLTTVGNLPFRRICKEFGADITCGEMACAVPLIKGLTQEWALTKRHATEDVFGVQLCGNNPNIISQVAQLMQETAKVDFIDLNIGCPIELIYQQGGGSALMRRSNVLELAVRTCAALSPQIPFTVKMRTGVYADKSVAHELMPLVEEWGAGAVTLHGRSREQRYTRNANWEYIEECAAKVQHIPVIGNGDILNLEDYNEKRKIAPHVLSVMIGRGALIKPWLFKEIKEQKHWHPSSGERFDILRKYVNYGLEHWGSDTKGVENTRRFLLEWQSFMYRYIPYDLLLYPPQRINQRPQKFRGRDELETLMSSPNSADWVRLSEMLLGPVPQGFTFVPKHKANAY